MKRFYIMLIWLLPTEAQAGTPPTGVILAGTVQAAASQVVEASGYATCGLSSQLTASGLVDQGPALSFWLQNTAGGPPTLTLPSLGRALTNAAGVTSWSYYSSGAAILNFTSNATGTITVPTPGNLVTSAGLSPSFSRYASLYNATTGVLTVQFTITMGDCSVPFSASYQA